MCAVRRNQCMHINIEVNKLCAGRSNWNKVTKMWK
jgi:hypothetical protein